jgi:hypothetical protein
LHEAFAYMHTQLATGGRRLAAAAGRQRGQGTVEYVALVLLVGLVMLGVVAAMKTYKFSGGQELGDLIVKKIKEAVGKVTY